MEQSGHRNVNNDLRGHAHKSKGESSPSPSLAWKPFQQSNKQIPSLHTVAINGLHENFSHPWLFFLRFLKFWRRKSIYYKNFEINSLSVSKMWQTLEPKKSAISKIFFRLSYSGSPSLLGPKWMALQLLGETLAFIYVWTCIFLGAFGELRYVKFNHVNLTIFWV